jgi:hypothetical protein
MSQLSPENIQLQAFEIYKSSFYSLILFFTRTSNSLRSSTTNQLKRNMQFTLSALTALAIATLAVATPARRNDAPPASECNTGSVQCCDSTSTASNPVTALLLGSLGIPIGSVTGIVGLTCSPITGVGVSGTSWFVYYLSPFLTLESYDIYFAIALRSPSAAPTTPSVSLVHILYPMDTFLTDFFSADGVVALGCTPVNLNL